MGLVFLPCCNLCKPPLFTPLRLIKGSVSHTWVRPAKLFPSLRGFLVLPHPLHNQKQKQKHKESNIRRLSTIPPPPDATSSAYQGFLILVDFQEPGRTPVCVLRCLLFHERGSRNSTSIAENCFKIPPTGEPLLQSSMHWGTDTGGTSRIVNLLCSRTRLGLHQSLMRNPIHIGNPLAMADNFIAIMRKGSSW